VGGSGHLPAPGRTPRKAAGPADFGGVWRIDYGGAEVELRLTQSGKYNNRITGTFGKSGTIAGSVEGNELRMSFADDAGRTGAARLTLQPDGRSVQGLFAVETSSADRVTPDTANRPMNGLRTGMLSPRRR
jgi:hypothetical protein